MRCCSRGHPMLRRWQTSCWPRAARWISPGHGGVAAPALTAGGASLAVALDAGASVPAPVQELRRQHGRHLAALRLVSSGRVLLGAGVAAAGAMLLGLGHPYWAPVSAAAVLQSTHVRMTWHRSIQRGLGTAAGLVLGALLLQAQP